VKVNVDAIKVTGRIRKEVTKIEELAVDITQNGLLNPLTVMPIDGGKYQLLAGLRRLRAAQSLGWTEIDVNVVSASDAEAKLRIEISENEQREPFTYTEKMDFARLIEEIERVKALERMSVGGKGGLNEGVAHGPHLEQSRRREIIGAKIGMSGKQYDRAKYIAANATPEVIDELDRQERTIRGTYDELRAKKGQVPISTNEKPPKVTQAAIDDAVKKLKDYPPMSPMTKAYDAVGSMLFQMERTFGEIRTALSTLKKDSDKKEIADYFSKVVMMFESFKKEIYER